MSDLLAEVDEAMRQERLAKFWHENKTFIIFFVVLTIVATGALSAYRTWDANTQAEQTAKLIALQEAGDYPTNILDSELEFRPSIRGIALLSAAGTAMQRDSREQAQTLYARLAQDTKIPDDYRYLGILMNVRLQNEAGEKQPQELLSALDPVLSDNTPWKPHAQIDAALIQADHNPQEAITLLNAVADTPDLPASLYERAQKLHHVISANVSNDETTATTDNVETN